MTVAIVLKPDFTATFSRGVLRLGGTLSGLLLATALFHFFPASAAWNVILIARLTYVLRWVGPANYGIFVTAVSALIVLMIALTGVSPKEVIAARGVNTAAGGSLALIAYWLWPTWEKTRISETMANMLDAYREYFRVITSAYMNPGSPLPANLESKRLAGRLARSNMEASVDRFTAEPGTTPKQLADLNAMLASSHRLVFALMSLEAWLSGSRPVAPRDEFRVFANDVDLTLYLLAARLRGSTVSLKDLPDLREDHQKLLAAGMPGTERYELVNVESDRVTNSLNTIREQVLNWAKSESKS